MKKISHWAKDHKWSARFVIILSYLIFNFLGVLIGILLNELDIVFPAIVLYCFIFLFLTGIFLYPFKEEKGKNVSRAAFYKRQKSCDLLLVISSFFMVIYLANKPDSLFNSFKNSSATIINNSSLPADSSYTGYKSTSSFSASMKDENGNLLKWKERKKLLKQQVKAIKKSKELSQGAKIALVFLSVLIALGLLALVAALACDISCSGAGGIAILVGLGGTALVIFLLVHVIRSINGKKRKKKQAIENMPDQG